MQRNKTERVLLERKYGGADLQEVEMLFKGEKKGVEGDRKGRIVIGTGSY